MVLFVNGLRVNTIWSGEDRGVRYMTLYTNIQIRSFHKVRGSNQHFILLRFGGGKHPDFPQNEVTGAIVL